MIKFGQKEYSEYNAFRLLWTEVKKRRFQDIELIDKSSLIPVLKGNSVVLENFVISASLFNKDKYRAYLKMGAKVNLPDKIKFPYEQYTQRRDIGRGSVNINGLQAWGKWYSEQSDLTNSERFFSELQFKQKEFKGGGDQGPKGPLNVNFSPNLNLSYEINNDLADVVRYDKTSRSLILETKSIDNFLKVFDILPFGIEYKKYILNPA